MSTLRKIPIINQGLEVLSKILKISFFLSIIGAFISILPYFGIQEEDSGIFSLVIFAFAIYIIVDTFRGLKILESAELDETFNDHVLKAKNFLSYAIITLFTGGILLGVAIAGGGYYTGFVILACSILLIGFVFYITHTVKMFEIVKNLGVVYKISILILNATKVRNLYYINLGLGLLLAFIELGPELDMFAPLDRNTLLILAPIGSIISIYFAYRYYSLYKQSNEELESTYKKSSIIGNVESNSHDQSSI